jgi:hypothetical protein
VNGVNVTTYGPFNQTETYPVIENGSYANKTYYYLNPNPADYGYYDTYSWMDEEHVALALIIASVFVAFSSSHSCPSFPGLMANYKLESFNSS